VTIFGVSWQDLRLEEVERFLNGGEPEGLLREAKGSEIRKDEVRRQVCAFANSHDGGFLILGASRDAEGWRLDGARFEDEPPTWITNVVGNGGVSPYPDGLDTRAWPIEDGKHVAVVWIPSIPTPPCRHTWCGIRARLRAAIPVRESLRLAQVFARGDQALKAGEETAHAGAREILQLGQRLRRFNLNLSMRNLASD
jgi:predicted HTH transcriptional regulator